MKPKILELRRAKETAETEKAAVEAKLNSLRNKMKPKLLELKAAKEAADAKSATIEAKLISLREKMKPKLLALKSARDAAEANKTALESELLQAKNVIKELQANADAASTGTADADKLNAKLQAQLKSAQEQLTEQKAPETPT